MITLNPTADPMPPMRTWLVRGQKTHPDGTTSIYTGTAWGRTRDEAVACHHRLIEADKRIRTAARVHGQHPDLEGFHLAFTIAPELP